MRERLAQVRQKHLELGEAAKELPGELEAAQALEAQLESGGFAPELEQALREVEAAVKALDYDEGRTRQIQARVAELAGADRDLHSLEQAEAALPGEREHLESCRGAIRAREEAMAEERAAWAALERELTRLPSVEAEARTLKGVADQAEVVETELGRRLGAAAEALQRCEGLAPVIRERRRERDLAAKDQSAYEELAKAFGRNGIQALIIENALPEIEIEANQLLARMTDGQLTVRLNTQRALRTGQQAETLDIEISDGMGPRRYELYSGGEAFRVNFAIRIALSKLLARRAGARLETLVIDEGFGSQDLEGRERLVEAIQAIQDEFAKILVITHIEDLKDRFPTRIEVSKGPGGSQVAVY
jgi:exonuclease SbcC